MASGVAVSPFCYFQCMEYLGLRQEGLQLSSLFNVRLRAIIHIVWNLFHRFIWVRVAELSDQKDFLKINNSVSLFRNSKERKKKLPPQWNERLQILDLKIWYLLVAAYTTFLTSFWRCSMWTRNEKLLRCTWLFF